MRYKHLIQHFITHLFCLFLLWPNAAFSTTAQDVFRQGLESAQIGDYRSARNRFEAASRMGLESAALQYNLAVSYYKLKLFGLAYSHFLTLVDHPNLAAVAAYNLGLTAEKQKLLEDAKRWYSRVISISADSRLIDSSHHALQFLNGQVRERGQRSRTNRSSPWRGILSLKFSFDDNIGLDIVDSRQQGQSSELDLTANGYIVGSRRNGWRLSSRLYGLRYAPKSYVDSSDTIRNSSEFNFIHTEFAASYNIKKFAWNNRISTRLSNTQLDGLDYQQSSGYELRTERDFLKLIELRFRFRYREISSSGIYEDTAGNKKLLRIDVQFANGKAKKPGKTLRFSYQYEENHRHSGNDSPQRTWFRFSIQAPLASTMKIKMGLEYRFSTYKDYQLNVARNTVRNDDRTRLRLEIDYSVQKSWHLLLGMIYVQNDSDIIDGTTTNLFDYSQRLFYSGLRWYY